MQICRFIFSFLLVLEEGRERRVSSPLHIIILDEKAGWGRSSSYFRIKVSRRDTDSLVAGTKII